MLFLFSELRCYDVCGFAAAAAAEASGDHVSGLYGPKEGEEKGDRKRMGKRTRG